MEERQKEKGSLSERSSETTDTDPLQRQRGGGEGNIYSRKHRKTSYRYTLQQGGGRDENAFEGKEHELRAPLYKRVT